MADQIIIELIGDPSGLAPIANALKAIGQLSQEQEEQFAAANAAFVATANKATAAVKEQTAATQNLGQSVKNIIPAAAVATIKSHTDALNQNTTASKVLAGSYNDLKARAAELDKEFKNTGSKEARLEFLALRSEMKETELQNRTLVKSMATGAGQFGLLAQATSGAFGAMAAGQGIMEMFNDGTAEGAEAAKKAAKAQQLLVIVMGLAEVARAAHEAGELKTLALSKLTAIQDRFGITTKSALIAAQNAQAASTDAGIAVKEADVAASIEQTVATEAGTVAAGARITTQGIENGLNSESIPIRYAAAAAQWALNAAMGAYGIALGVIGAIGIAYEMLIDKTLTLAEKQELLNNIMEAGLKVTAQKLDIVKSKRDEELQQIDNRISLATAEGKSDMELIALQEERIKKRKEFSDQAKDAAKTEVEMAKNEKANSEVVLQNRERILALEKLINEAKTGKDANAYHLSLNLDNMEAEKKALEDGLELNEKMMKTGLEIKKESDEAAAQADKLAAEKHKKELDAQLKDIKAYYDARVTMAVKNSQQELDAKKGVAKSQANIDLSDPNLTGNQKIAIRAKLNQDLADMDKEFKASQLNRDKELLTMQLSYISADAPKRLEIMNQLVRDEQALKILAVQHTQDQLAQEIQINLEAAKKIKDNELKFAYDTEQEKLKISLIQAQSKVSGSIPGSGGQLDAQKAVIDAQKALDVSAANFTIQNEAEKQARIYQIDQEAAAKKKKLSEDADKSELSNEMKLIERMQKQAHIDNNVDNPDLTDNQAEAAKKAQAQQDIQVEKDKLSLLEQYSDESVAHEQEVADQILAIKKDLLDKENALAQKAADEQKAQALEVGKGIVDIGKQVLDAVWQNQAQSRQNNFDAQMKSMDAAKQAELSNTSLTNAQKAAINLKYQREEAAMKLQQWKADQKAKEEQALINGMLAFTMSLAQAGFPAGLITGALALASAGVQAALIASATPPKFATGTPGKMVTPEGFKWVGEQGPELIWSKGGDKIMTNPDSIALLNKYQIPAMANMDELLAGTGVHISNGIDYDKLSLAVGKAVAKNINTKQLNIRLDENGFTVHTMEKNRRVEYYNNRTQFK